MGFNKARDKNGQWIKVGDTVLLWFSNKTAKVKAVRAFGNIELELTEPPWRMGGKAWKVEKL